MNNPFTNYIFTPKLYKVYTELRRDDVSITMKLNNVSIIISMYYCLYSLTFLLVTYL